ncbi:MAG: hypothetical protein V4655_10625 [Bdellovibrionota bacterium]|nr:MAG: hypothetical protein EOP10_15420 [Pseudomonadota bacterium]
MSTRYFLLVSSLFTAALCAPCAHAGVQINLSGSAQKSTNNFEKTAAHSVAANIGVSLGSYVSIGLTHRRSFSDTTGQKKRINEARTAYVLVDFADKTETVTNSVDLTLIPYAGIVSPFIFGGVARQDYTNTFDYQFERTVSKQSLYPVPNYGGGIAIQLGQGFQLKITQTITPGKQSYVEEGAEKTKTVQNTYTELGLGYKL